MDFGTVVDQAIPRLRQRSRTTYRPLQRQCQLDEAHLEALKDEILYGQRLAVGEEGGSSSGLVRRRRRRLPRQPPAPTPHPPRACPFDVTPPETTGQRRRPAPSLLPP